QVRQRWWEPSSKGGVELSDLFKEHIHRPAVGNDMMHDQHQDVLVRTQAQEPRSYQWPAGQSEGPLRFLASQLQHLSLAVWCRHSAEINGRQLNGATDGNDLHRVSVDLSEGCTQRFVVSHNLLQTFSKSLSGQGPAYSDHAGDIVRWVPRFQAVEKPH